MTTTTVFEASKKNSFFCAAHRKIQGGGGSMFQRNKKKANAANLMKTICREKAPCAENLTLKAYCVQHFCSFSHRKIEGVEALIIYLFSIKFADFSINFARRTRYVHAYSFFFNQFRAPDAL